MENEKYLYQKIINDLEDLIMSEKLKPNERLPTEIELAKQYKVSKITSKKALDELKSKGIIYSKRGSGTYVSDFKKSYIETKKQQNPFVGNSKEIALLIPFNATTGGILSIVNSASKILNEHGFLMQIYNTKSSHEYEKILINELYNSGCSGIIYFPSDDNRNLDLLYKLYLNNYPIVSIDKYFSSIPINYVVSDNFTGGYDATEYLINLGHRKISFVSDASLESASSVRERFFSYCKALKAHDLEIDNDFIMCNVPLSSVTSVWNIYSAFIKNIVSKNVTAIFAINDTVASILVQIAYSIDLKVPDDISIISFDNTITELCNSVRLTTIKQDLDQMGLTAANMIISCIDNEEHNYYKVKLKTQLIEGTSCKRMT